MSVDQEFHRNGKLARRVVKSRLGDYELEETFDAKNAKRTRQIHFTKSGLRVVEAYNKKGKLDLREMHGRNKLMIQQQPYHESMGYGVFDVHLANCSTALRYNHRGTLYERRLKIISEEFRTPVLNDYYKTVWRYFEDGRTVSETGQQYGTSPRGWWSIYTQEGRLRAQVRYGEAFMDEPRGMLEGKIFDEQTGLLKCQGPYKDNKKHGIWVYYGANGQTITARQKMEAGEVEAAASYRPDGTLEYIEDPKNFITISYDRKGRIEAADRAFSNVADVVSVAVATQELKETEKKDDFARAKMDPFEMAMQDLQRTRELLAPKWN